MYYLCFSKAIWSDLLKVTQYVGDKASFQHKSVSKPIFPSSGYTAPKVNKFMQCCGVLESFLSLPHCPINTLTWLTRPGCNQILCHLASFICFVYFSCFIFQPYRIFCCSHVKLLPPLPPTPLPALPLTGIFFPSLANSCSSFKSQFRNLFLQETSSACFYPCQD